MSCCCNNTLPLCKVPVCGADALIKTGAQANPGGEYKLVVNFLETQFTIKKVFALNENLNFPSGELNEFYVFTGKIYKPDGSLFTITQNEIEYDCINFETVMNYDIPTGS